MSDDAPGCENPFSARFLRPGGQPFLFTAEEGLAALLARLRAAGWWGQITGPHGAGKSSLLAALVPAIQATRCGVVSLVVGEGERRLPADFATMATQGATAGLQGATAGLQGATAGLSSSDGASRQASRAEPVPPALVTIDGYEQLGRWGRYRARQLCRRRGLGLVVTAHHSVGLPPLYHAEVDLGLACRVVAQLQAGRPALVTAHDVAERLPTHDGDLRETLFALYDLYAQRWAAAEVPANGPRSPVS